MTKYTPEHKLEVIKNVLEGGISVREAAKKYNIHHSNVQKWVDAYEVNGMSGIARQHISYTGEFKQEVVEYMRANGLSLRETAIKFNIGNHSAVAKWERIYLEEGPEGLYIERRGRANSSSCIRKGRPTKLSNNVEEDLIAENQRLRLENEYLKKLNALVQQREISGNKKRFR